ncbi:hypothetical protein PAL_GLEAN10021132 [Pteropus alecto]|uniref:Uncharacterized protein n=1 Tax=Pteropus alecto TaxID=9402 RepID=L5KUG7_PTEAL|nr:hypothetical protein PAL_GLEAN10021132 [Pteropus alecto]
MGREAWLPCCRVRSPDCPGGPGWVPVLGLCFWKSRLTPMHWARDQEQPFGKAVAAPSPSAQGLPRPRQPRQPEQTVVREHRGGNNHSHRALKRGVGA